MLAESVDGVGRRRSIVHRPRFAVIYEDSFNYLSKMCLLRMRRGGARDDRRGAQARGIATVVAGDPTPAITRRRTSTRGAAVVIAGEGEITLVEVLDALTGTRPAPLGRASTASVLRGSDGRVVRTPAARDSSAISTRLPLPAWDLVDVAEVPSQLWRARHGYFSMNIVDDARLPVSLQLVREADLRPALHARDRPSASSTRSRG